MEKHSRERGQVSIDFLSGMTLFLLSLIFVFGFLSSTLVPFTGSSGETLGVVARASDNLYTDKLTSEDMRWGELNSTKTENYFKNNGVDQMENDLGVPDVRSLNVTVTDSSGDVVTLGTTDLKAGDPIPSGVVSVVNRKRVAHLEGEGTVHVNVRVW